MQKQPCKMWGEEMKAKKFLNIIKKYCCGENCAVGKCPMAARSENQNICYVDVLPENWDIEAMLKAVEKVEGKRGK